jgi:ornithine cyclodeaminase/alanine dehydrogenase
MALLLSRGDLEKVLDWTTIIPAVEAGFIDFAAGNVAQPQRTVLRGPAMEGVYVLMPCAVGPSRVLGAKVASIFNGNAARGLPAISGLYLLAEYDTGRPLAVMEAAYMTAVRTAAATCVATRALARRDSMSIGLFGTGTQAEYHVRGLAHLMPGLPMKVWGTSPGKAKAFAERMSKIAARIDPAGSADEAAGCDIVVVATSSPAPVFDGKALKRGAHVNSVGTHQPKLREIDTETVVRSRLIGDSREAVFAEDGDILIPLEEGKITREHVVAELGEVLAGRKPGRTSRDEVTLFKSNGVAFQDAVTAKLAFERATAARLGMQFEFGI